MTTLYILFFSLNTFYACISCSRLGSTCNHVAAVLFKLDYAWQNDYTSKACTSRPVEWTAPSRSKAGAEPKKISEMEWRKPHYNKKRKGVGINPCARKLFNPVRRHAAKADNSEWFVHRIGRIIASYAHSAVTKYRKIMTHRNVGSMDNLVGFITGEKTLDPNLQPLKYGREMEPIARN